jgi:hypothetical protein
MVPTALRHRPWEASPAEAAAVGFTPRQSYPPPMVDPADQIGEGPKEGKGPAGDKGNAAAGGKGGRKQGVQ